MPVVTLKQNDSADINIGIDKKARKDIAVALSAMLADTYSLQLKTQYYHWNVTGALFQSLHILFQEQYNAILPAVDEIAERIRSLGYVAPGTYREFLQLSSLKEDKDVPDTWQAMVKNLTAAHESLARSAKTVSAKASAAGDESTVDLMVRRMQEHEKTAWMLRSLLAK